MMVFLTLLVVGLLCLAFSTTRLIGVVGITLLLLIFPFAFIVLLIVGCIFLYLNRKFNKGLRYYVQPKLPS